MQTSQSLTYNAIGGLCSLAVVTMGVRSLAANTTSHPRLGTPMPNQSCCSKPEGSTSSPNLSPLLSKSSGFDAAPPSPLVKPSRLPAMASVSFSQRGTFPNALRLALLQQRCGAAAPEPEPELSKPRPLTPRADLDMAAQKLQVKKDKLESYNRWLKREHDASLYGGSPSPLALQDDNTYVHFHRHSLRQLVLEACTRQISLADQRAADQKVGKNFTRMRPLPPGHLDLTIKKNFLYVLQDIDVLMAVAQERPKEARDRIVAQIYEHLALLSLWSD